MHTRTVQTTVLFLYPFRLQGMITPQPPGLYRLVTDQEEVEHDQAFRTITAFVELPAMGTGAINTRLIAVDPDDLRACVRADRLAASVPAPTIPARSTGVLEHA